MKLILYQATMAITQIDFVPGPFRCQIEQQHFAVGRPGRITACKAVIFTQFEVHMVKKAWLCVWRLSDQSAKLTALQ